jgi:hypothetical protein
MPTKKKPKKPKAKKSKNLVLYVEDSTMKCKVFDDIDILNCFVKEYRKIYSNPYDGFWIDLIVTDIKGKIDSVDSIEVLKG